MPEFISNSPEETFSLGEKFAESLQAGDIAGFNGELGSGKTQFIKGICSHLKVNDPVTSPTFNLLNEYSGMVSEMPVTLLHLDLYRLKDKNELHNLGLDNYNFNKSIILAEWPKLLRESFKMKNVYFNYGPCDNVRIINY